MLELPYYTIVGNNTVQGTSLSVSFNPVSTSGVDWLDSDRDALVKAIVDVFAKVSGITSVNAFYYTLQHTDVTPVS